MPKRKFLIFFAVVAIVALFSATEVMAFADFCEFDPADLPISVPAGAYTIELMNIETLDNCDGYDPADFGETVLEGLSPCYRWNYKVYKTGTDELTGLNFLALFIPDCECTDPYIYFDLGEGESHPNNLKIYPVAYGEPTVRAGQFNEGFYMLKGTPNSITDWSLVTTTMSLTSIPAILATGRKTISATFQMPGPGCAHPPIPEPLPQGVRTSAEIKKIIQGDYSFCLQARMNETTKCYEAASYACVPTSGDCLDVTNWCGLDKQAVQNTATTVQFSGTPECENIILVPEDAAYNLCYNEEIHGSSSPTCLNGPTTAASTHDTTYANPCGTSCIECVFGGWAYCACW